MDERGSAPGLGAATTDAPVLDTAAIAYLDAHRVGHLATVDPAGRPHVVPVCYAAHAGRLYIAIDAKPKRVAPDRLQRVTNIAARPDVCLVVDDYAEDWQRLGWLQVRGVAALVDDAAERAGAFAALRARYPQYRTMALETRPLLGITPGRVVRWQAREETTMTDVIAALAAERAALAALVHAQPPERLTTPNTVGAWSVNDTLAHLAGWQEWMGRAYPLRHATGSLPDELRATVMNADAANAGFVAARAGHTTAALLDELTAGLEPLRRWLGELGERADAPRAWAGTELSVNQYLGEFLLDHERAHRAAIAAALGASAER